MENGEVAASVLQNCKFCDVPSGIANAAQPHALNIPPSRVKIAGTIFCVYLFCWHVKAQNVVPNYSYESYEHCPGGAGNFSVLEWYSVKGSPDYFHQCGGTNVGVPLNLGGGGYAYSGNAYTGVIVWSKLFENGREFFSSKLNTSLISGKKYKVEFYVSAMDSMWYAVKNIGAYFSTDSIEGQMPIDFFFSKTPQIKYTGPDYLTDKEGWMKVEGSFYADGGEQFITMGNFDDDDNTDTLFVGGATGGILDKRQSYYYIDDVSVELDTMTGLEEYDKVKFGIYPNPAKESIVIETEFREQTMVKLFDITGREVFTTSLTADKTTIDVSGFAAGVYTAVLLQGDVVVGRRKILVE